MASELPTKLSKLSIDSNEFNLNQLHATRKTLDREVLSKQFNDIINAELINKQPLKVLEILQCVHDYKIFIKLVSLDESLAYLKLLQRDLKRSRSEYLDEDLELLQLLILNFKYQFDDVSQILRIILPHAGTHNDVIQVLIVKLSLLYKNETLDVLSEEFDNLVILENILASISLLNLVIKIDPETGKILFMQESFQKLLTKIDVNSDNQIIIASLESLSLICGFKDLREIVYKRYLQPLLAGLESNHLQVKLLSCLVLSKLWGGYSSKQLDQFKLDEILPILLENLENGTAMETLANLSLRAPVKRILRNDQEFIFDLTKLVEERGGSLSGSLIYGLVVTLVNLTYIPEEDNSELGKLKKHAMKGLEDEQDSPKEDIIDFNKDLVERKVLLNLQKYQYTTTQTKLALLDLIYNIVKNDKDVRNDLVGQNVVNGVCTFYNELKSPPLVNIRAAKVISLLLLGVDPKKLEISVGNKNIMKMMFSFLRLKHPEITVKDQFYALVVLTNISPYHKELFTDTQWQVIDIYLRSSEPILQRSVVELISNLTAASKDHLVRLFNLENPDSKKRLDIIVELLDSTDPKIQAPALVTLLNGAAISFICEDLITVYPDLVDTLVAILVNQAGEIDIFDRVLSLLTTLMYNSEATLKKLKQNKYFERGLAVAVTKHRTDNELLLLIKEAREMLNG